MKSVKCIGDSITEGWALPDPQNMSYPGLCGWDNYGSAGAVVQSFLPEAYKNTLAYRVSKRNHADITILFMGTNDVPQLTPHFKEEYEQLIDDYKEADPKSSIVLVAPPKTADAAYNRRLEKVVNLIRDIARERHLQFVDLYDQSSPDWLTGDGIHPSAYGQQQIARILKSSIEKGA